MAAVLMIMLGISVAPIRADAQDTKDCTNTRYLQELIDELDFDELDMSLEENHLPEKLRFSDLVKAFAENGTDGVDGRMICDYVFDLFFYELAEVKPIFFQIVVMALLFALFGKLLIAKQGYVADMGFLMVYVGIVLLLLQSFTLIGRVVEEGVSRMLSFMTAFVPAYAATLLLSGNSASAGFFYEVTLGIVYVIELVMKVVFLPGVHIYVLLVMIDHLFEESRFSKLAELIGSALRSLLKFGLALVMGLGVVQSILAPAKDRLAASSLYHGIQAMPGLGNTVSATGELLLGCAIMIKNSVGAAALILLLILCMAPLCSVLCFTVMYRLIAALLEPFSDKRIVECVAGVGRGSGLYCRILADAMLYFLITISVISASTSFIFSEKFYGDDHSICKKLFSVSSGALSDFLSGTAGELSKVLSLFCECAHDRSVDETGAWFAAEGCEG